MFNQASRELYIASPMPDNYFAGYLPILIHIVLVGGLATVIISLSWLIGERKPTRAKMAPYESGMAPVGDARGRFSVQFYLVAMLFILFDVEAVFLYPWAVILRDLGHFGLWEMLVYIGIVLVGFFYVWKKGVLEWGPAAVRSQAASGLRTNLRDVQSGAQVDVRFNDQRGGS
jgi:NADH-quinone oxidoreductase subunit A